MVVDSGKDNMGMSAEVLYLKNKRKKRKPKLTKLEKEIIAWKMFCQISRNYFGR